MIVKSGCVRARVALSVVAGLVVLAGGVSPAAADGASSGPFTDPQADGYIGLCDLAGNNVTSGNVNSVPFVWKAVSSVHPPVSFSGNGQNAGLAIYQARQGLDPGDWSGLGLIGTTAYKYKLQPTAEATYRDISLASVLATAPPLWNGLYALRMQFGRSNYGVYNATYPMTIIQVTGNSWHVVSGGLVNCKHAEGESLETITGVANQLPSKPIPNMLQTVAPRAARATQPQTSTPTSTSSSSSTSSSTGLSKSVAEPISAPVTLPHDKGGGVSKPLIGLMVLGGVILVGLVGLALGRRQGGRDRPAQT